MRKRETVHIPVIPYAVYRALRDMHEEWYDRSRRQFDGGYNTALLEAAEELAEYLHTLEVEP